mgnify:CR=1 FL=1
MTTKDDFRLVIPYVEFSKQNRGVRPMLLDWGWPGEAERGFTLTDYVAGRLERLLAALPPMRRLATPEDYAAALDALALTRTSTTDPWAP